MRHEFSHQQFEESTTFIRQGRYREALQILNELNKAHPDTKNVIYSAALCLEELGRPQKALPLCNRLIDLFNDPRAHEMKTRLEKHAYFATPPRSAASIALDPDLSLEWEPAPSPMLNPRNDEGWNWTQTIIWAIAIVLMGSTGLAIWKFYERQPASVASQAATEANQAPVPSSPKEKPSFRTLKVSPYTTASRTAFTFAFGVVLGTVAAYYPLKTLNKLKGHNLHTNLAHIGAVMFVLQAILITSRLIQFGIFAPDLGLVAPVIAMALSLRFTSWAFELGSWDLIKFYLLLGVFTFALLLPTSVVVQLTVPDLLLR